MFAWIHIRNIWIAHTFPSPKLYICTHIFKITFTGIRSCLKLVWFKSIHILHPPNTSLSYRKIQFARTCAKKMKCRTFSGQVQYFPSSASAPHLHTHILISLLHSSLPLIICLCFFSSSSSPSLSSPVPVCKAIKSSYGEILVIQEGQAERSRRESVKWMKPND